MVNELLAVIKEIKNHKNLHIVKFDYKGDELFMMSLELPNIRESLHVKIGIKPLNVVISKENFDKTSFSNTLQAKLVSVEEGELLCSLNFIYKDAEFQSVITKEAFLRLDLSIGEEVFLCMKANDIFIKEICDEGC